VQPPFDDQDQRGLQLVHRLRAISVDLELARAAFARASGLHDTDVRALIHLLDADRAGQPATPGWLSTQTGLTSPSTTALIDRLERAGHVARQHSTSDRRKIELHVSDQAAALGWSFFGPLLTAMIAAMRAFTPADLDTIDRFLGEIAAVTRWPG
jgi:DNA-binding MarR family transcriptional regulator